MNKETYFYHVLSLPYFPYPERKKVPLHFAYYPLKIINNFSHSPLSVQTLITNQFFFNHSAVIRDVHPVFPNFIVHNENC